MARLPYLSPTMNRNMRVQGQFGGLNQQLVVDTGEFADQLNASHRFFPAIAARRPRGTTQTQLTNPNGLIYKNHLFWVDGTKCYYNGSEISGLTVTNGKKQLVGMGAYIIIFPDKKQYNTADGSIKNLESSYTQSGTITFAPTFTGSVLTRITATGIQNYFEQYDAVTIAGCSNASYNATKIVKEKGTNYIVVDGTLSEQFTQASGLTFKRTVPSMDYVCEMNNRIWGCSSDNHEIYASKLGDASNWYSFEGISTDSYALTVGSDGPFTGCVAHMGHVIFFKENTIHMMYGDRPSNFSLNTSALPGVREGCSESIEIVNETLYYVGRNGVYSFDGAVPYKISEKITEEISDAVMTQEEGKLYMSCLLGGQQTILTYDPRLQIWDKEDDDIFRCACYGEGHGYYINKNNFLATVTGSDTNVIEWMLESGDTKEDTLFAKYVSKLMFNFWLAKGTEAMVYIKCDDGPVWVRKGLICAKEDMTYTMPITPERCNKYRYRIKFKGDGKLLGSARYVEGGTELNGSIHFGHITH